MSGPTLVWISGTAALLCFVGFGWFGSKPETWAFIEKGALTQHGAANLFELGFLMMAAVVFARIHRRARLRERQRQQQMLEIGMLTLWLENDRLTLRERESLVKLRNECLIGTAYEQDGRL